MKKLIGYVGVDSGTIIISDPCYLIGDSWAEDDYQKEVIDTCNEKTRQVRHDTGAFKAVLSEAGLGDGVYPVYAEIVNNKDWGKRVKKITIDFLLGE
jgi:hypothetical protein